MSSDEETDKVKVYRLVLYIADLNEEIANPESIDEIVRAYRRDGTIEHIAEVKSVEIDYSDSHPINQNDGGTEALVALFKEI